MDQTAPAVLRLSTLESRAVTAATSKDYLRRLQNFVAITLCDLENISGESLDQLLVDHFDEVFVSGKGSDYAARLISAVIHYHSRFSRLGSFRLPRAWRALKGWKKLAPGGANIPLPLVALHGMIGAALYRRQIAMAVALLLGFWCYLRPGEMLDLAGHQLIPPSARLKLPLWGIIVRAAELGRMLKVGEFDASVMFDGPGY